MPPAPPRGSPRAAPLHAHLQPGASACANRWLQPLALTAALGLHCPSPFASPSCGGNPLQCPCPGRVWPAGSSTQPADAPLAGALFAPPSTKAVGHNPSLGQRTLRAEPHGHSPLHNQLMDRQTPRPVATLSTGGKCCLLPWEGAGCSCNAPGHIAAKAQLAGEDLGPDAGLAAGCGGGGYELGSDSKVGRNPDSSWPHWLLRGPSRSPFSNAEVRQCKRGSHARKHLATLSPPATLLCLDVHVGALLSVAPLNQGSACREAQGKRQGYASPHHPKASSTACMPWCQHAQGCQLPACCFSRSHRRRLRLPQAAQLLYQGFTQTWAPGTGNSVPAPAAARSWSRRKGNANAWVDMVSREATLLGLG